METTQNAQNWKKQFFPFWISQMLSLLGSSLVQFSLVWWLTEKTGSATVLATASLVAIIPEIIIQPFAGAITDRINRKQVIIIADSIIAFATLILGVLFFVDSVQVWHIYAIMMIRAIGSAFHYPAQQASVSLMVPKDQLAKLAGLNQAVRGIINLVSAPLGALLLEFVGAEGSIMVDVVTAILAVSIVSFTAIPKQEKLEDINGSWVGTVLNDMKDGLRYLLSWKGMMVLTVVALAFKIALSPAFSLIPLLVSKHFNGGAAEYSLVDIAFGVGVVAGGLLLSAWGGFKRKLYTMLLAGIGVGGATFVLGILPETGFYYLLVCGFVIGFFIPLVDGPLMAILQEKIDNEYQGRVLTMFGSIIWLSTPVGLAIAGPVSDAFGLQIWYKIAGTLVIVSMLSGLFFKSYRNIDEGPVLNPNKELDSEAASAAVE